MVQWFGDDVEGVHKISLRFHDPFVEDGFLKSRSAKLKWTLGVSGMLVMLAQIFIGFIQCLRLMQWQGTLRQEGLWVVRAQICIQLFFFCTTGVAMIITQVSLFARHVGVIQQEAIFVVLVGTLMLGAIANEKCSMSRMSGQDPELVFGDISDVQCTDSTLLLSIIAAMSGCHLVVPVRWCMVTILEALAMGMYTFAMVVFGSSEPGNVWINSIFLIGIVICNGLGMRCMELRERLSFSDIINERTLRCKTEHELSQLAAKPSSGPGGRARTERSEAASTTNNTAQVFGAEGLSAGSAGGMHLEEVKKVGRREHWVIEDEDIVLVEPSNVLGSGSFGVVIEVLFQGTPVAAKLPKQSGESYAHLVQLGNELRVLRHVRHPNILQFHGAIFSDCISMALILELVEGSRLGVVCRGGPPTAPTRFKLAVDVCRALRYLHTRKPSIVHGDLKDSNIIVEHLQTTVRAKLLDFGLSRVLTPGAGALGGTLRWMAPELMLIDRVPPDVAADVFSFGRLIFMIATCRQPLADIKSDDILSLARAGRLPDLVWPEELSQALPAQAVVQQCVAFSPAGRPSMVDVHDHVMGWPFSLPRHEATHSTSNFGEESESSSTWPTALDRSCA